ncbi:MAG: hypothetical protein EON96_19765 [Caulobacteraceae bacterium]|nr:MAG: hypothetical protein EON96_19765 [Caulobacteraceae bacterium]
MAKPEITASDADAPNEAPPLAPVPAKAVAGPEVAAVPTSAPARAKSEKTLRLAQALRANLKRRKIAARPARQSN